MPRGSAGGEILAETDASGNTTSEYIFFGGKRIAMLPAGGNPLYYIEDMLGSSRVITQSNGLVCYDADFYPYGGERIITNTCPQNYKFQGKERDAETGNDDFGARYYSSRFGRWLSADWSAIPVPMPYANLTNPQTLNLYAMVADDPESFADLDGHAAFPGEPQTCVNNCPQPPRSPSPQDQDQTAQPQAQPQGHGGIFGQVRDYLDIVEVSGSYGVGVSVGGQAGVAEGKLQLGTETEGTIGLGLGNGKVETFAGGKAEGKIGPAEGEIKAGLTVSTNEGLSLSAKAAGSAGPVSGSVTLDKNGVHGDANVQRNTDKKLSVHVTAGLGVGVGINFSQARRAYQRSKQSLSALGEAISSNFRVSPYPSVRPLTLPRE